MKKQLFALVCTLALYTAATFSSFLGEVVRAPFEIAQGAVGIAGDVASAPFGNSVVGNVVQAPFDVTEDVLGFAEDTVAYPLEPRAYGYTY